MIQSWEECERSVTRSLHIKYTSYMTKISSVQD